MATMNTSLAPLQPPPRLQSWQSLPEPARRAAAYDAEHALADLFPDLQAAADAALADLFPAFRLRHRTDLGKLA